MGATISKRVNTDELRIISVNFSQFNLSTISQTVIEFFLCGTLCGGDTRVVQYI